MYLVERECGGEHAAGGGCGAWYVTTIRAAQDGDRFIPRSSPEAEGAFYNFPRELWDSANPDEAIDGGNWVCSSCRRVEW
jgi:hypothetical protein